MMDLIITPGGAARCVYGEEIDLHVLGTISVRRASHVDPDEGGKWWVDLSPVGGPKIGPHRHRSEAVAAELQWLGEWMSH